MCACCLFVYACVCVSMSVCSYVCMLCIKLMYVGSVVYDITYALCECTRVLSNLYILRLCCYAYMKKIWPYQLATNLFHKLLQHHCDDHSYDCLVHCVDSQSIWTPVHYNSHRPTI